MTQPAKYRKKPVVVEAILYTGSNHVEVQAFTGAFHFGPVASEDRDADPDITAEVYDELHSTWVGVKDGQWVIRGVKGEFYPCDAEVFDATYDLAVEAALRRCDDETQDERIARLAAGMEAIIP